MASNMSKDKEFIFNFEAQNSLGSAYHLLCNYNKALEHYEQAAMIYQQLTVNNLLQANGYKSILELQFDNVRDLITIISAKPTFAITLSNISSCHFELGDLKSAIEFSEDSKQFFPPDYRTLAHIGYSKKLKS
jgi:tetratricopeptide (TPR) repeat protein